MFAGEIDRPALEMDGAVSELVRWWEEVSRED